MSNTLVRINGYVAMVATNFAMRPTTKAWGMVRFLLLLSLSILDFMESNTVKCIDGLLQSSREG